MAQPARLWSSVVGGPDAQTKPSVAPPKQQPEPTTTYRPRQEAPSRGQQQHGHSSAKRSTSPHYTPKTNSPEKGVFVLTLLTDKKHHQTMTKMRERYFPRNLNRLEAHITLFHALPESKLEKSIKPVLTEISQSTTPFPVVAAKPFRLSKGVAIGLSKAQGGDDARAVHTRLKGAWNEFLSRQDSGGFAAHYTIMNKVDDEAAVQKALSEVEGSWKGCHGTAEGLSLFRYDRGNWVHLEDFRFSGGS